MVDHQSIVEPLALLFLSLVARKQDRCPLLCSQHLMPIRRCRSPRTNSLGAADFMNQK